MSLLEGAFPELVSFVFGLILSAFGVPSPVEIYTQLIEFETVDQYHVRVAKTIEEACEFVTTGFEFVTEMDGAKIFRKRK